nr:uncharacterized protein LOC109184816 [Ipomoea batatas]
MTLKEKVYELGYKEEDSIRLFSLTDNGLKELLTDEDACALANYVIRPMLVEIWVVLGVVGNDEENNGEAEISADEGDGDSDGMMGDSANELSDSEFEVEETGVDDSNFFNFIDPNVEYGGDEGGEGDGMDEHAKINPKYINPETHFSGSEGEGSEGNLRARRQTVVIFKEEGVKFREEKRKKKRKGFETSNADPPFSTVHLSAVLEAHPLPLCSHLPFQIYPPFTSFSLSLSLERIHALHIQTAGEYNPHHMASSSYLT